MGFVLDGVGRLIARYLEKPVEGYEPCTPSDPAALIRQRHRRSMVVGGSNRRHASGKFRGLTLDAKT